MHLRRIGSGGFLVGGIGLHAGPLSEMVDGGGDESEAMKAVHRALDLGVNVLDTADVAGPYTNELLVGRVLLRRRDEAVLATKGGQVAAPGLGNLTNARPEYLRKACEASLRRLQTDRIDLYQLHRVDPEVPFEESWGALAELVREGKVRALGLCDASVEQLQLAMAIFPVTTVQVRLSLWDRAPLAEVLSWCLEHGVGVLAAHPAGRPASTSPPRAVIEVARRYGATPAQIALAWVLAQGPHVLPLAGPSSLQHLDELVAAVEFHVRAEDLATLTSTLPAPRRASAAAAPSV